ncbi:hypothetical protein H9P43_008700 [Blastocladiella emersonii ATCC 22665]|nr:hypothetical protein H9P43_008700 [Blastocladiella emersonii ATCC 22665]
MHRTSPNQEPPRSPRQPSPAPPPLTAAASLTSDTAGRPATPVTAPSAAAAASTLTPMSAPEQLLPAQQVPAASSPATAGATSPKRKKHKKNHPPRDAATSPGPPGARPAPAKSPARTPAKSPPRESTDPDVVAALAAGDKELADFLVLARDAGIDPTPLLPTLKWFSTPATGGVCPLRFPLQNTNLSRLAKLYAARDPPSTIRMYIADDKWTKPTAAVLMNPLRPGARWAYDAIVTMRNPTFARDHGLEVFDPAAAAASTASGTAGRHRVRFQLLPPAVDPWRPMRVNGGGFGLSAVYAEHATTIASMQAAQAIKLGRPYPHPHPQHHQGHVGYAPRGFGGKAFNERGGYKNTVQILADSTSTSASSVASAGGLQSASSSSSAGAGASAGEVQLSPPSAPSTPPPSITLIITSDVMAGVENVLQFMHGRADQVVLATEWDSEFAVWDAFFRTAWP